MNIEHVTLALIKPDIVSSGRVGQVLSRIEAFGYEIAAMKLVKLTLEEAKEFYAEHKEKHFYTDLTKFMASAPLVAVVLRWERRTRDECSVIMTWREDMSWIRQECSTPGIPWANAVHGSDSIEAAEREIRFFFDGELP